MAETKPVAYDQGAVLEQVVVGGDLSKLTPTQRVSYYRQVCESLSLNPLTKPFSYIMLNGKLVLYANRDCTDQLRHRAKISIQKLERERQDDVYVVTAYAETPEGRTDSSIGAVSIAGLRGDALANAMMKAETKAKRRVTLSIVGLGWLDETEVDTIPDARPIEVTADGEILPQSAPTSRPPVGKPVDDIARPSLERFCAEHGGIAPQHLRNIIAKYHGNAEWNDLPLDTIIDLGHRIDVGHAWLQSTDVDGKPRTEAGLKATLAVLFGGDPKTTSVFGLNDEQFGFLWEIYRGDPSSFAETLCDPATLALWKAEATNETTAPF